MPDKQSKTKICFLKNKSDVRDKNYLQQLFLEESLDEEFLGFSPSLDEIFNSDANSDKEF